MAKAGMGTGMPETALAATLSSDAGRKRSLISICVPVFNEEENISRLVAKLGEMARSVPDCDFEFVFTDNASADRTFELLSAAAQQDARIRVLRFSRNFGFQKSILTNYLNCRGDAAVQIDADLQDPPEMIPEFIRKWREGYLVVYGVRRSRKEGFFITQARKLFYRLITRLGDVDLPQDAGDFRLIDRKIIEHLRAYSDNTPYLRGLIAAMGYRQIGIDYDRHARFAGKTKFNLFKLITLAVDGICSQSIKPLTYITFFGFVIFLLSIVAAVALIVQHMLFRNILPAGFSTLAIISTASFGLNAAFLGILGEYVGRIYRNTRNEPMTIIETRIET